MGPVVVLATAGALGVGALALTGWMSSLAGKPSPLLRSGLHALLACLGGACAASLANSPGELVAFAALALAAALLVVIDLVAHRLPDVIVAPAAVAMVLGLAAAAFSTPDAGAWPRLGRALISGVVLGLGYLALALIKPSGLGLGDVKLAGVLGIFLGWFGWMHVLVGTLAAFVAGGVFAVALLLTTTATRQTPVAFGPWMIVGAAVGAALGSSVLSGAVLADAVLADAALADLA